ncbi:hypothetical protein QUA40_13320 [Microcoleus sp. Pol11C3]|uniref:hypothetical protein n=1 Tax=Microcoleus sp. Pol11C3 TaxID=3055390 RepID=UPI002FD5611A
MHKFAAASENELIVFGAARPGYGDAEIARWIEFMQGHNIKQVCCLLAQTQLIRYCELLGTYSNPRISFNNWLTGSQVLPGNRCKQGRASAQSMEALPPGMRYQALPGNEYNHLGLLYVPLV